MSRQDCLQGGTPPRRAAAIVVLAVILGTVLAGGSRAYEVTPGSKGNIVHVQVDDREGLIPGTIVGADVAEIPSWMTINTTSLDSDRLVDLAINFDVADVAPGSKGHLKIRLTGRDPSGRTSFDRTHFISLEVRGRVAPVQQSFSIVECCLAAAGVENPDIAPATFVLAGPTPNPFVSLTNIVFGLPVEGGRVTMEVFDISGRQVRSIETPRLNGGFHRITWDGRNDEGIDVSPGTYFCRLSCGSWSATAKTQLVR